MSSPTLPLAMRPAPLCALPLGLALPVDPRPPALAVLEDWLCEHARDWVVNPEREPLEIPPAGEAAGAPSELVDQAYDAAWMWWHERTEPALLMRQLAAQRGAHVRMGYLRIEQIAPACRAHHEALLLADQNGRPATAVRTWIRPPHRVSRAGDEIRLHGTRVSVHRHASLAGPSGQTIRWFSRGEGVGGVIPDGWRRWSDHVLSRDLPPLPPPKA